VTAAIAAKLAAIIFTVVLGWVAGRQRWLGSEGDPARVLGNACFYIFIPALMFRTTVRLDLAHLPWRTLAAFFVPTLLVLAAVVWWQRRITSHPAQPAARAITATFGNSVQLGIPMAAALFGEAGLAVHITLVSLHALVLLSVPTMLAELALAHDHARRQGAQPLGQTLRTMLRNTIIHPVVLPVLAGLAGNLAGLQLPGVVDESLSTLASAVVPVCLVLIGVTLAAYGLQGQVMAALRLSAIKLLVQPALVLVLAHWGFGLAGLPLAVVVVMASLPVGSNALVFAQRYDTLQAEATAATVLSTGLFAFTASGWLWLLGRMGALPG
jgi:predicted permease